MSRADSIVVLDFETTGLSPRQGDRAIEIGAVRLERGEPVARFQELMNPGFPIPAFIEGYTGISNRMLRQAPPCAEVMARFHDFLGDSDLVAHNASFDQCFLDAELGRIDRPRRGAFACSMLAARRILQDAPNHKLSALVAHLGIPPSQGTFHRALYDSDMTAHLWNRLLATLRDDYFLDDLPFASLRRLCKVPKKSVPHYLANLAAST